MGSLYLFCKANLDRIYVWLKIKCSETAMLVSGVVANIFNKLLKEYQSILYHIIVEVCVCMCFFLRDASVHKHCTVELHWLKHLWNHENMFQIEVVRDNEC